MNNHANYFWTEDGEFKRLADLNETEAKSALKSAIEEIVRLRTDVDAEVDRYMREIDLREEYHAHADRPPEDRI